VVFGFVANRQPTNLADPCCGVSPRATGVHSQGSLKPTTLITNEEQAKQQNISAGSRTYEKWVGTNDHAIKVK
jgi:hypothetical protein